MVDATREGRVLPEADKNKSPFVRKIVDNGEPLLVGVWLVGDLRPEAQKVGRVFAFKPRKSKSYRFRLIRVCACSDSAARAIDSVFRSQCADRAHTIHSIRRCWTRSLACDADSLCARVVRVAPAFVA